jgi:hypothetical protein
MGKSCDTSVMFSKSPFPKIKSVPYRMQDECDINDNQAIEIFYSKKYKMKTLCLRVDSFI